MIEQSSLPKVDLAAAYFGNDYVINDYLKIHQPTIQEIIDYGEKEYWQLINCVTIISSDMKSELAEAGQYWGDVPDFELFHLMMRGMPVEKTSILFGDGLDFTQYRWYKQTENDLYCMADGSGQFRIDEFLYVKIVQYISAIHGIAKKPEFAGNETTRQFMIEEDKMRKRKRMDADYKSTLFPLSSYLCSANKLSSAQIGEMKIFAFLDNIKRTCAINSSNLLLTGIYAGKVDGEKVSKSSLDSMRDLYDK